MTSVRNTSFTHPTRVRHIPNYILLITVKFAETNLRSEHHEVLSDRHFVHSLPIQCYQVRRLQHAGHVAGWRKQERVLVWKTLVKMSLVRGDANFEMETSWKNVDVFLLLCNVMWTCRCIPTLQRNIQPRSSEDGESFPP